MLRSIPDPPQYLLPAPLEQCLFQLSKPLVCALVTAQQIGLDEDDLVQQMIEPVLQNIEQLRNRAEIALHQIHTVH
ncbi:MAG: hypothetical protein RR517_19410 [Pseudomonas sp.]